MCMCVGAIQFLFLFEFPLTMLHEYMSECYDFMLLLDLVECMLDTNNLFSLLFKLYFCTPYWKIGTHPKPYLHLTKNIETWWMHCYPFKITSEPFTTTIGSKLRTFQNSNEFRPNSSNPSPSLFFSILPLQNRQRSQALARPLSPHPSPSYSLCPMQLDTKGGGSPRQSCQDLTLPLSL
jgi:hypothetical protein